MSDRSNSHGRVSTVTAAGADAAAGFLRGATGAGAGAAALATRAKATSGVATARVKNDMAALVRRPDGIGNGIGANFAFPFSRHVLAPSGF